VLRQDQGDQVVVEQQEENGAVHSSAVGNSTVTVSSGISQEGGRAVTIESSICAPLSLLHHMRHGCGCLPLPQIPLATMQH
jgi:hypothetical protein